MRYLRSPVWRRAAPVLLATPIVLMAASTIGLSSLSVQLHGLGWINPQLIDAALQGVILTPLYLLAVWCALGGAPTFVRLVATGLALVAWSKWWGVPGFVAAQGELLCLFAAPLFMFRLWGINIRRHAEIADGEAPRSFSWRPRMSLRNLFELTTALSILMVLWKVSDRVYLDNRIAALVIVAIGGAWAMLTWACLATRRAWIPAALYLLATATFLAMDGFNNTWISTSVLVAAALVGYRLIGYRMEQAPVLAQRLSPHSLELQRPLSNDSFVAVARQTPLYGPYSLRMDLYATQPNDAPPG